jgi:hypothetical protein
MYHTRARALLLTAHVLSVACWAARAVTDLLVAAAVVQVPAFALTPSALQLSDPCIKTLK